MVKREFTVDDYCENLIPKVNPNLGANKSGIALMLKYRIDKRSIEVDSCPIVKEMYKKVYGVDVPECADTILNALNPLKSFCIYRLKIMGGARYPFERRGDVWVLRTDLLELILKNLDDIFTEDYKELYELFDIFSYLAYSFANMMPAPAGYNATGFNGINTLGKGSYHDNNDYPYFYLMNLEAGMDNEMHQWLISNIDKYYLAEAYSLKPPFSKPDEYYSDDKKENLIIYLRKAIQIIRNRSNWLKQK